VIELSQRELQKVRVIENTVAGYVTVRKAAELLQLSQRQVKRLKAKCRSGDAAWVKHGNTGTPPSWAIPAAVRERVVEFARTKYAGFNDTHLPEKLVGVERIPISRESVRRVLRGAGLRSPQKRRPKRYRARRERKPRFGAMVLGDASREIWLENRGPGLTLLGFQDDATSQVVAARFQLEYEDSIGYLRLLRQMV